MPRNPWDDYAPRARPPRPPALPPAGGATGYPFLPPATIRKPGQSWKDLIESDPGYGQKKAWVAAQKAKLGAQRAAGLRGALIKFGGLPADFKQRLAALGLPTDQMSWLDEDIDPATIAASSANEGSLQKLQEQQHKDNLLALQDVLAAKGILSSGQTGFETGRENQRYSTAQSDAVTSLLDYIGQLYGGTAGQFGELEGALADAGTDAVDRLMQLGVTPTPAADLTWDPDAQLYYKDGAYYNPDFTPAQPPAPAPPFIKRKPGRGRASRGRIYV